MDRQSSYREPGAFEVGVMPEVTWNSVVARPRRKLRLSGLVDERLPRRKADLPVLAEFVYAELHRLIQIGAWRYF